MFPWENNRFNRLSLVAIQLVQKKKSLWECWKKNKGVKNVVADHLSRLEVTKKEKKWVEEFLDERLFAVNKRSWFVDMTNFKPYKWEDVPSNRIYLVLSEMSTHLKYVFLGK